VSGGWGWLGGSVTGGCGVQTRTCGRCVSAQTASIWWRGPRIRPSSCGTYKASGCGTRCTATPKISTPSTTPQTASTSCRAGAVQGGAGCCRVLQCGAGDCSVLQCLTVLYVVSGRCISVCCSVLQCVAVCCCVLQCFNVLCVVSGRCITVGCSVLQCVAMC